MTIISDHVFSLLTLYGLLHLLHKFGAPASNTLFSCKDKHKPVVLTSIDGVVL